MCVCVLHLDHAPARHEGTHALPVQQARARAAAAAASLYGPRVPHLLELLPALGCEGQGWD